MTKEEAIRFIKREVKFLLPEVNRSQQHLPKRILVSLIEKIKNSTRVERTMWDGLRIVKIIHGLPLTNKLAYGRLNSLIKEAEDLVNPPRKRRKSAKRAPRASQPSRTVAGRRAA